MVANMVSLVHKRNDAIGEVWELTLVEHGPAPKYETLGVSKVEVRPFMLIQLGAQIKEQRDSGRF